MRAPLPRLASPAAAASLAAVVLLAPLPASASLVVALDTATMVQQADHIAVVDVKNVTAAWDDKHEHITSTIDLSVVESWKGSMTPATHVRVVQPGGTVGDMSLVVFGMTRFTPGERALVFLHGTPDEAAVVGMSQGKRAVRRDVTSGRWMVYGPDRAGASFVRPAPAPKPQPGTVPILETRVRALDEVRSEVRDLMLKAKP